MKRRLALLAVAMTTACGQSVGPVDGDAGASMDVIDGGDATNDAIAPLDIAAASDASSDASSDVSDDDAAVDAPPLGPISLDDHIACTVIGGPGTPPIAIESDIHCTGDIDSVRVAPGVWPRAYVSFGVVPGNRATRLVTLDPTGGSAIESNPIDAETIYVLSDASGTASLAAYGGSNAIVTYATRSGTRWSVEPVPPSSNNPGVYLFADATIGTDGSVQVLQNDPVGPLAIATRTAAGQWSSQMVNAMAMRGSIATNANGAYAISYWAFSSSEVRLVAQPWPGSPLDVTSVPSGGQELDPPRIALSTTSTAPTVIVTTPSGATNTTSLYSFGTSYTQQPLPSIPSLPPSSCPTSCSSTPTMCAEQSAGIPAGTAAVASTDDGRTWLVFLWQQIDRDATVVQQCGTGGPCTCSTSTTADSSTLTLFIASVLPNAPPTIAWSIPITPFESSRELAVAARGTHLLVAYSTAAPNPLVSNTIHELDLDTTQFAH